MTEEKLKEAIKRAMGEAEETIKNTLNLPPEERKKIVDRMADQVKIMLDKKLEDLSDMEKMASAMHFRTISSNMPLAQAWLCDYFIITVGLYVREKNNKEFLDRMERLVDYIIDYRDFFRTEEE